MRRPVLQWGIVGLAIVLLFLLATGRQCGPTTTMTPAITEALDATWTPQPTPSPTLSPSATSTALPLPTPTPIPTRSAPTAEPGPLVSPLKSPLQLLTPIPSSPETAPRYGYRIVDVFPHDPTAFTQGLVYHEGFFYEGTGLRGRSSLRKVAIETGQVVESISLDDRFFGEGITILGDRLYQLTWQSNVGFVYDWQTFEQLEQFAYPTEGWGLTHDGAVLIMSDGTPALHFLDPETLQEVRQVTVRDGGKPVWRLNELEYVRGEVYANVWQTDLVARIDPQDGTVMGWIDLSGLLSEEDRQQPIDVLNGIAYDSQGNRLFVTGKLWPKVFEVAIVPEGS